MDCFSLFSANETDNELFKVAGLFHREVNTKWTNTEEKVIQSPRTRKHSASPAAFSPPKKGGRSYPELKGVIKLLPSQPQVSFTW